MHIEVKIDPTCKEPRVMIWTDRMTDDVHAVITKLSEDTPQLISGFKDDTLEILEQADIIRAYALNKKVFATTYRGEFTLRIRLYELEARLDKKAFIRISHSEIINIKAVKHFDLSFTGTICVTLSNGTVSYVSRRYVPKIKKLLGI